MTIFTFYPLIGFLLLMLLLFSGYEDYRTRKITTITFLVFDIGLMLYYLPINYYISLLLIPLLGEFWIKKYSIIFYLVIPFPLLLSTSILTISISYSILLVKVFSVIIRNFGRGDLKVLQTIAVAFPLYPHLPPLYSILPPVIPVLMLASLAGMFSGVLIYLKNRGEAHPRKFTSLPRSKITHEYKYWIRGNVAVYKIPLVTFISGAYAALFILSLLRVV